jgi:hypothetical protein
MEVDEVLESFGEWQDQIHQCQMFHYDFVVHQHREMLIHLSKTKKKR